MALRDTLKRQSVAYPMLGAVLAAGAPLGLLFLRRLVLARRASMREDVRRDRATYAYLTASTTIVLMLLGRVLGRSVERLAALSTTDALTGLLNRRAFNPRLQAEIDRSRRSGAPFALLLLDIDELKAINDQSGHAAGDRALQRLAGAIRREMRSIDVGARLGGDEFGFLAVGTADTAAVAVAERLLTAIAHGASDDSLPITASIGIVGVNPTRDSRVDLQALMQAADGALYEAKRLGRNRAVLGCLEP